MSNHEESVSDDQLLMGILNSTPVLDDEQTDLLVIDAEGRHLLRALGGNGSAAELALLRTVRDDLQRVVRGAASRSTLSPHLHGVSRVPVLTDDGVVWTLQVAEDRRLAARAVLAWALVDETLPGALRPCANDECHLFLLDRSRAGTARWCSMATCGNRMKARRHRTRVTSD